MESIQGKVAIITGASSGIGEATARAFAQQGVHLVLAARREERLRSLQQELQSEQVRVLAIKTDVTQQKQTEQLAKTAFETFGKIDILINNAGIMLLSRITSLLTDEWDKMLDVNVKGLMYCTAATLPYFLQQKQGHIINISSVAGRRVFPTGSVYCATKFAVNAFTEGLRIELAADKNIRVTTIEPGVVATELTHHITQQDVLEGFKKMRGNLIPLQATDIAESVLYAASAHPRANVNEIMVMPTNQR